MKYTVTYQFRFSEEDELWVAGYCTYDTLEEAISEIAYMKLLDLYRYVSEPLHPVSNHKFPEHFKN